jgi:hypothetical protein
MRRERLLTFVFAALTIGFIACQKDQNTPSTGNSNLGIKLQALNKSFTLPVAPIGLKSASLATSALAWDTAHMVVSGITYEAKLKSLITHHDSIEISYKWNGPQELNLLDTTITLGNFTMTPGFYDEIELKVEGTKQATGLKPVFYLHGVYTKADVTKIPVRLIVNENVAFKTEKDSVTVTANDNADFASVIQIYLDQLMADIQPAALDNATLTNGILVISADKNRVLYLIMMRNLIKNHHNRHFHMEGHHMMGH